MCGILLRSNTLSQFEDASNASMCDVRSPRTVVMVVSVVSTVRVHFDRSPREVRNSLNWVVKLGWFRFLRANITEIDCSPCRTNQPGIMDLEDHWWPPLIPTEAYAFYGSGSEFCGPNGSDTKCNDPEQQRCLVGAELRSLEVRKKLGEEEGAAGDCFRIMFL